MEIDLKICESYIKQRFEDWVIFARNYVKDKHAAKECVYNFLEKQFRLNNWNIVYLISIGNTQKYSEGFLYTSIKNCCLDYLKQNSQKANIKNIDDFYGISDKSFSPEEQIIKNEQRQRIQHAINQLTDREKEIIEEYFNELSYSEIANKFGVSVKTVDNTLQRIKLKLRDLLQKNILILFLLKYIKRIGKS